MRPVSWQQLEYFLVVARTQHISRAALEIGLSQPALSRAIANLEDNLNVPLFERVGRSIVLTRFGELFRRRVDRALHEIDDARTELTDLVSADHGLVHLGFVRTLGAAYLPNIVRCFKERYPNIRFRFDQNSSKELERMLIEGQLDLIFGPRCHPSFEWSLLSNQELILIAPHSHPLARARQVALSKLKDEEFVSLKRGHRFREMIETFCKQAGFIPTYSYEGDDLSSVIGFVSSGFGIAIVAPEDASSERVASLRLVDPAPKRSIGIGWVRDRYLSASATLFRDFVLQHKAPDGTHMGKELKSAHS